MFNKYFGNYILRKKIITSEQLKKVLEEQKTAKARVKLGVLAIESSYMSAFQVNRVHKIQALQDKKFGEIAISEGFMTEMQLTELLSKQKTSTVMLGQILVDEGMITYEKYETLLTDYKNESGFTDKEIEILKSNNTDEIVNIFLQMVKNDEIVLFSEYVELFIRNIIRFIDSDVIIEKPYVADAYQFENFASQKITGDNEIVTGIAAKSDVILKFASIYADEKLTDVDEMTRDSIGEFMNVQNGLFVSNLFHRNINCDLNPQQFESNGQLEPTRKLLVLPCELSFGKIEIIFNI